MKEAIQLWNDAMSNGEDSLKSFSSNIVQNNAQLKTYLSTCSKDAPASLAGYKASLNAAGVSTDTLRLKTILLISAISMVIGVAIQGIAKALDDYIHRLDNAKEALSSTQSELSSINSEINDTTAKIAELEALDPSSLSITDKEDLQRLKDQNEELRIRQKYLEDQEKYDLRKVADLTKEKYGQKYGNVNRETVDEYRSLYANKDTKTVPASSYLTGGGTSSQPMPYAASKQNTDAMRGSGTLADLIAQYEYYIELKKEAVQNNDADGVKQYDDKLSEIAERLRSDRTELQGFSDDLKAAGGTSKELDNITWQLKAIDDLLLSPGQRLANFLDKDILAEDKQKLVDLANAGKLTQNELASDFSEVDKYLKENGLTLDDLISVVKIYKEELADVTVDEIGNLSISQTIDQLNTQIKPAFDSLKSAWQEIFTDDGFALNSIDILSTCDSIKSKLDEMSEIGLNVDYSAFEDFVTVLNDTESTEYDVENAFDSLATSITQAGLSGTEDFETMKAALEDLGVVNNEMVAFDNLISKTNALADAGIDLANATEAEMQAFVDESVSAEHAGEALALLQLKKALINQTTITTAADCQNILALAQAANVGIVYLEQLNTLMNLITQRDSAQASGDSRAVSELNRAIREFSANVVNNLNLDDVKVDFTPIGSGAKSAGSKAGKDYKDGLKEELNNLNSIISGITGRIDDQISVIRSQKEAALESIDAQIDALNEQKSALEAQKKALEEERDARIEIIEQQKKQLELAIKAIDKQIKAKEKVIKGIQDEIKAMKDANEQRKLQANLMKEQYELERLQHQRTILQYSEDLGMHYVTNTKDIRSQKDKVDDAKLEIEIANKQKQIDLIEKEIELLNEKKGSINEQIDLLDEQIDQINEFYDTQIKAIDKQIESIDKQIEALQKQKEETGKYYESLIEGLENSKSKYEELTELVGRAELSAALEKLGIDEEALLNGSEEEFNKLKDAYMNIVTQLNSGNDEVLDSLRELSGYDGTAPTMLEESNTELNTMNDNLATSNTNVGTVNSSLADTATKTSDVATNVSTLNDNLSQVNGLITEEQASFNNLKEKIDEVITKIKEKTSAIQEEQQIVGGAVSSEMVDFLLLKGKIDEVQQSIGSIGDTINQLDSSAILKLLDAFQLLYNKLVLISITLGAGMEGAEEGAVGGIASAIQALNEISLEEGIIAQFTNLKTAIDEVTSAIGGGGGGDSEGSAGGEGSGSSGGKTGGVQSGGKGSKGEGNGGGDSLTGAIETMGETAKEVIGEPDAEGDGTVIGEFGALETAVTDVTSAIGGGESEGSEGQGKGSGGEGESGEGNLISSIKNLGETTEETLGEPGGDGVIGRFEQFKQPIQEADEHVHSISDGLAAIDGQEVECTIKIHIESDGFPSYASGTALGAMNLNSAEYNAKYTGNAHVAGTANVTGNWGVRKPGKSLVGELGQELWVHSENGTFETVGDNGPEWIMTEKNDLIFNHLQTKELLDKGNIVKTGKAYANGTIEYSDGTIIRPNGEVLYPLQPWDRAYDLMQKFDTYFKSIDGNLDILTVNARARYEKQMDELAKHVTNVSNVTNNRNVQPVINQNVTINCPNVTNDSGVENIQKQLGNLSLRAYQEPLHDY